MKQFFYALVFMILFHSVLSVQAGRQEPYRQALPGYKFSFPSDHFSHDGFKTEWWYYTGHLESSDGQKFGFELTFFRSGLSVKNGVKSGPWAVPNAYMAHFALTDISSQKFFHAEKFCRPGLNSAGAESDKYKVWTENWSASEMQGGSHRLLARQGNYAVDLQLSPGKEPVIHGVNGVSQKASCAGCASHYYSLTRMPVKGTLVLPGKSLEVKGLAWMDHEFGSNQMKENQVGWDWFSIQLEDGTELMLYHMRLREGGYDANSSGTLVHADGSSEHLLRSAYKIQTSDHWTSSHTKGRYPAAWHVQLPERQLDLYIKPRLSDQELVSRRGGVNYWEGCCEVTGKKGARKIKGQAYVELTGYDKAFDRKI